MDDTKKMLRTIINGQSLMKSELLGKIDNLDKKIDGVKEDLSTEIKGVEKRLTERIDKLGKSLAYLEDDAPTREEFDGLTSRVVKIEHKVASA